MKISHLVASAVAVLCVGVQGVVSHGFLTAPKVEFRTNDEDPTAYSATIDGVTALPPPHGMHYGWGPSVSTDAFTAAFGNSSYKSLREFVMKYQVLQPSKAISSECGRTRQRSSVLQPVPEVVVWQHGDGEGFTLSHEGPCEVWCDNERVFAEKNCAKTHPQIPAKLAFNRAKCLGKSRLQIVWLALHEGTRWQVYMNCATLAGKSTPLPTSVPAPLPTNMPVPPPASDSSGQTWIYLPGTVLPAPIQTQTRTPTATRHQRNETVNTTRLDGVDAVSSRNTSTENDVGSSELFDCSFDGDTSIPVTIQQNRSMHTHRPIPHVIRTRQPRRLETSSSFDKYEAKAKATGPTPDGVVEAVREGFERPKERRASLVKEYGYA